MTNMSLGTSSQCKTHHISHSCVSTAVFLVLVRVVWLSSTCIVLFLCACSVSAIPYPELHDIIEIFQFGLLCVLAHFQYDKVNYQKLLKHNLFTKRTTEL